MSDESTATPTPTPTPTSTPAPPVPTPGPDPMAGRPRPGDFHVILTDLADAAQAFHTGAKAFSSGLDGGLAHARVDSGDANLDQTTGTVLSIIDEIHKQLVAVLDDTGVKLTKIHDNYQQSGIRARELYDNMLQEK